jgi:hypothetical protein
MPSRSSPLHGAGAPQLAGKSFRALAWLLPLGLLGACGGPEPAGLLDQAPSQIGAPNAKPGQTGLFNGAQYLVDTHQGGAGQEVRIERLYWGRLVDIYDTQAGTGVERLVYPDIVIAEAITDEPGQWALTASPLTGKTLLRIEAENTSDPDDEFDQLVLAAQASVGVISPKGVGLGVSPPFSVVARNSALVIQFDDLIDADTISLNDSVRLVVGNPPVTPFDARLLVDQNHGGISSIDGEFHSSRLIVDLTISEFEQAALPAPLSVNSLGLPASSAVLQANFAVRLPTLIDPAVGQFEVLTNVKGRALAVSDNGPLDLGSSTADVVRSMRSGNSADPSNGFLSDLSRPSILGRQPIQITSATAVVGGQPGYDFLIGYSYNTSACAIEPAVGDVIKAGSQLQLEVVATGSLSSGVVTGLQVRVPGTALPQSSGTLTGPGIFTTAWRNTLSSTLAPCFVRFSPDPATPPNLGVSPDAQVVLEFSEPIEPSTVRPFESMFVRNTSGSVVNFRDFVVGDVLASTGIQLFRFQPLAGFNHQQGSTESYFLNLVSSKAEGGSLVGIGDLSGNPLEAVLPPVTFQMAASAPNTRSAGFALRFGATSEDEFAGADLRGQFTYDVNAGSIRPRPFSRFSLVADRTVPIVGAMTISTVGLQEPLSNLGSRLHAMWRHCDVGLPQFMLQEDKFPNLDVEGISFSPIGGQVTATFYPQFEMQVGHSDRIPDEVFDPLTLTPFYPGSGLFDTATFIENFLKDPASGPKIVHPRAKGFLVSASEVFVSPSNTTMVHFPWNRNVAPEDKTYFTWRDTAVQTWGGRTQNGATMTHPGVPVTNEVGLSGIGIPGDQYGILIDMVNNPGPPGKITPAGVPTVGLPLLMEFRCYPGESLSVNTFDVSTLMPVPSRPFVRAFSTGGFSQTGAPVIKDPDAQSSPNGGFINTPAQGGTVGQATPPRDNSVYIGQLDLLTRVSRVHTVVFNSNQANPDYVGAVLEPKSNLQPAGTSVSLAFRGHDAATLPPNSPYLDTNLMDVYGEPVLATNALILNNPTWNENINANDQQRFIQIRITFVSNPVTELSPTLSGLGVAWRF